MWRIVWIAVLWLATFNHAFLRAQQPPGAEIEITNDLVLPLHLDAARESSVYLDASRNEKLVLDEQPIFAWTNPRRSAGQAGHIFLWKLGNRPFAVCTVFSFAQGSPTTRRIIHEWHSLSETTLVVEQAGKLSPWRPRSGIKFNVMPGVNDAGASALIQRREAPAMAKQLDVHSIDAQGQRWPLRALTKPLATYETDGGLGFLIGWVGDAGNDPEMLMLLEPRKQAGRLQWFYAPLRMTDHELFVQKQNQTLWEAVRTDQDTAYYNPQRTYFRAQGKVVQLPIAQPN